METGKVFASNLLSLAAWCGQHDMHVMTSVIPDNEESITSAIQSSREISDCVITSGGAWKGERDLVVRMLDNLGWSKVFHRVRMGPGKAVGFGLLEGRAVFCLPGGPPSNQMAFLQFALPGLLTLSGQSDPCLPSVTVVLGETVRGQRDWTQFLWGGLQRSGKETVFHPILKPSRLQSMAKAEAILCIPEGVDCIEKGCPVPVQLLR
jgi:molybdopterin molybdotransferase